MYKGWQSHNCNGVPSLSQPVDGQQGQAHVYDAAEVPTQPHTMQCSTLKPICQRTPLSNCANHPRADTETLQTPLNCCCLVCTGPPHSNAHITAIRSALASNLSQPASTPSHCSNQRCWQYQSLPVSPAYQLSWFTTHHPLRAEVRQSRTFMTWTITTHSPLVAEREHHHLVGCRPVFVYHPSSLRAPVRQCKPPNHQPVAPAQNVHDAE